MEMYYELSKKRQRNEKLVEIIIDIISHDCD